MYGYRNAPQVSFAKRPVQVESVWKRYRSAKDKKSWDVSFVPA